MNNILIKSPKLILNNAGGSFYKEISLSLQTCKNFYFSVAFINFSGLQLLINEFDQIDISKTKGKIITSTYLNFTDIKSLKRLKQYKNIETKIYIANNSKGFHTKGYIFEYDNYYKIIIGSSNITQSALKSNVEWNVEYLSKKDNTFSHEILTEFNKLWDETDELNDRFIEQYSTFMNALSNFIKKEKHIFDFSVEIKPNKMQLDALKNLKILRSNNQTKALIIAATGTGKTYLAAFDALEFKPKRLLFVAHREKILHDAQKSFAKIVKNKTMGIFDSKNKNYQLDYTFAMVQTLFSNNNLDGFNPDGFDYIIIDEAHRSYSSSYQKILNYFTPKFLLGMTATPERTDGGNIFALFNDNIGLEVRLRDALREDLIVPFHYFGIADITDLSDIDISNIDKVAQRLSIKSRVDLIIENIEKYGHAGNKRKCLAFCSNKAHAEFMTDEFNAFGYPSICLTGASSTAKRHESVTRLQSETDDLEFVFTVDIFNEGVDIPDINLVLMLRPTQSPIIFTQQLGRGLRKYEGKEFLTVLDFIANHNKTFLIPIALSGSRYYEKDGLKVSLKNDFSDIPGCTNISLDKISKERIFEQLERVNFNSLLYLKKEYLEFKKVLRGNNPSILDYINYESSPDPARFIAKTKSYHEFMLKMENQAIDENIDHSVKYLV